MNTCCSLPSINPKACDNCLNNPSRYKFNNPVIYESLRYMNPTEEKAWDDIMEDICKNGTPIKLNGDDYE